MRRSSFEYIIPALLALAITIGLGFSIPILSTRYTLKLEGSEILPAEFFRYFHDVDQDGVSEMIELFYNSSGNLSVKLRHLNEATINQFNLPGMLPRVGVSLSLQDINNDGITDIFVCTERNDSIYLTIIDDIFGHPMCGYGDDERDHLRIRRGGCAGWCRFSGLGLANQRG